MTSPLACSLIHIVEDDDAVRQALRFLVESFGGTVQAHRSAEEFLAAAATLPSQSPACVLLDLHLGGQNGAEMLEQLQRIITRARLSSLRPTSTAIWRNAPGARVPVK